MTATNEAVQGEINLGEVSIGEIAIASYEALKMVFAASIAQLTTNSPDQARGLYERVCNDIDVQRAQFIEAMRADVAEAVVEGEVDGEVVPPPLTEVHVDGDGFEYEQVIGDGSS